jgi:hypothetical protein
MTLQNEIKEAKITVTTDSLSFSLNEFVSMYEKSEININPTFQRTFRWGAEQQSNLIESLFIGIPLPPIFVYENENGTWELIDGLQRSSTIYKFLGKLRSPDTGDLENPSILVGTKYLPSLDKAVWEISDRITETPPDEQKPLDVAQQLFLKRCRINIEVLKQPSSISAKFDLFQRLNRGGSVANDQEVRTCFVVMRNPAFASALAEMAQSEKFRTLCQISEDGIKKQQDVEYVTRIICHTFQDLNGREDLNEFLDRAIIEILNSVEVDKVKRVFDCAIELTYSARGDQALIPTSSRRKVFTLQGLESILVGIARNINEIFQLENPKGFVGDRIDAFWSSEHARIYTSSGMKASDRISKTIPLGIQWFNPRASNEL